MKISALNLLSVAALLSFLGCQSETKNQKKLIVKEEFISVSGKNASFYKIINEDGNLGLRFNEGEDFNVVVENQLPFPTSIHWHGLILPNNQDGVANVTQFPIYPNETYPYSFKLRQTGTFFMHSHYGMQEQKLFTAPLIIYPENQRDAQDVVLLFNDFTFASANSILRNLKCQSPNMKMDKGKDLADVSYDAFLVNLKTFDDPDVIKVSKGEKVRLRLINGAASTNFYVSLGDLQGELIAVDGNPIEPFKVKTLELAIAQRADVMITISEKGGNFPIVITGEGTSMQGGAVLTTGEISKISLKSTLKHKTSGFTIAQEKELKALQPLKEKKVDRSIEMLLSGNMKNYSWSINDQLWPNITPIIVKKGERVSVTFNNTTTMSHPMHLHGHSFQVKAINGEQFDGALRDTVLVLPNSTLTVEFDADNPGVWPFHCHNLYHQAAGMMTLLKYETSN